MVKENFSNLTGKYGDMLTVEQVAEYLDISKRPCTNSSKREGLRQSALGENGAYRHPT